MPEPPEERPAAVLVRVGGVTIAMSPWVYERLRELGHDLPRVQVVVPPHDTEHGYIEL